MAPPPFPDEPMRQQCGVSGVLWEEKGGGLTIQGAGSCVTPPLFQMSQSESSMELSRVLWGGWGSVLHFRGWVLRFGGRVCV